MVMTEYFPVYTGFIKDRLDSLVTQYCYKYKIYGPRQFDYRDEVLSDIGLAFCYTCKYCQNRPRYTDFKTYLTAALTRQVKYSILKQCRYERNLKRDFAYTLNKFGKLFHGHIIDVRIKDPAEELFRLCYDDFNFSSLTTTEKKIIDLYFWEEIKIHEIAKLMTISENTVRQSKKRALQKLRNKNRHLVN